MIIIILKPFLLSSQGLNKDKSERKSDAKVTNSFWVYSIFDDKWTCFYRNENNSSVYWNKMQTEEPRPRYAHQLVYDETNRVHFMFGGNPGGKQGKEDKLRLGDFWRLQLLRPNRKEVLRRCRILIRQCKFSELASQDSMHALRYLHTSLSSIVDHHNSQEEREVKQNYLKFFKPFKTLLCSINYWHRSCFAPPLLHPRNGTRGAAKEVLYITTPSSKTAPIKSEAIFLTNQPLIFPTN